jgi:hypothetical protein
MAIVAPLFVTIAFGMAEVSRLCDMQNQLAVAVRQGARLASMDCAGLLKEGESLNAKITDDIKSMLTANGLPGDQVNVFIVDPRDHTTPLDLDAPANRMAYFELRLETPYRIAWNWGTKISQLALQAKIVFRNGRSTIVQ